MMWTDDPVRDEMRYQYEQEEKERRRCLHCLLDEDSEMCEDCIEMIDEGGNEHDFV
jgi:hypothetical protein